MERIPLTFLIDTDTASDDAVVRCVALRASEAIALDPSIGASARPVYVHIETDNELTRGMTVVDRLRVAGNERNRAV